MSEIEFAHSGRPLVSHKQIPLGPDEIEDTEFVMNVKKYFMA
jgi:hypothetical protein